jgi:hypothetical protein
MSGQPTIITTRLDTDNGTGTTGNFTNDYFSEIEGNTSMVIASATLDMATSWIEFA